MLPKQTSARRTGFTLVELLIVMGIIALLVALTATAVSKIQGLGKIVEARNEMTQLAAAIQKFKSDFKVDYIPNQLEFSANPNDPTNQYLKRLFPKWDTSNMASIVNLRTAMAKLDPSGGDPELDNNQSLLFLLGGVIGPSNDFLGFAQGTDPFDPNATPRTSPTFEFPERMLDRNNQGFKGDIPVNLPAGIRIVDPWGSPYIYFTAINRKYGTTNLNPGSFAGVTAYQDGAAGGRLVNAHSYQLISAGADGSPGPGGTWTPDSGSYIADITPGGGDDLANFHPVALGVADDD